MADHLQEADERIHSVSCKRELETAQARMHGRNDCS